jgi:hypothetical protein
VNSKYKEQGTPRYLLLINNKVSNHSRVKTAKEIINNNNKKGLRQKLIIIKKYEMQCNKYIKRKGLITIFTDLSKGK